MASAQSPQRNGAAQELLDPAWQMCWRAPELALMLSDRAVAEARRTGDRELRLRAEAVALFSANRLGRGVAVTERAIAAVRDAEASGDAEVTSDLRVELACCARSSRSHDVALRVLHPVLQLQRIQPEVRAHALIELAAALPAGRKSSERGAALDEAERLYKAASELSGDTVRLLRARVRSARACHHRRHSEFAAAAEAAEAGLTLLERLGDPEADSGEIRAQLVLERVHALLDLGQLSGAVEAAAPVLSQPVRAAAAGPAGWLRLALATRVHLPEGQYDLAVHLLNDAVAGAQRHDLGWLLAEAMGTLSHVHEQDEAFVEALRCLREAYAADRRWRMSVHSARIRLLEAFPAGVGKTGSIEGSAAVGSSAVVPGLAESAPAVPGPVGAVPASPAPPAHDLPAHDLPAHDLPAHDPPAHTPAAAPEPVSASSRASAASVTASYEENDASYQENDVALPQQQTTSPSTPEAETTTFLPAVTAPADQVESFTRESGAGNVRDAARRLMDTLTQRSSDQREDSLHTAQETARETQEPTSSQWDFGRHVTSGSHESRRDRSARHAEPGDDPVTAAGAAQESASWTMSAGAGHEDRPEVPYRGSRRRDPVDLADDGADAVSDQWPVGGRRGRRAAEEVPEPFGAHSASEEPVPSWSASAAAEAPSVTDAGWPSLDSTDFSAPGHEISQSHLSQSENREPAGFGATESWQPSRPDDDARPDVTAIMPVIAVPPEEEPAPAGLTGDQRRNVAEPADDVWPSSQEPEPEQPAAGRAAHRDRLAEAEDFTREEPATGRRSRGKSLAEIRAGLQLIQDGQETGRSQHAAEPAEQTGGQRRARHAEPDTAPERGAETAQAQSAEDFTDGRTRDEFLSEHRELLQSLPAVAVGQARAEEPPAPAPDAGLADLLAEALMAYENGRRQSPASAQRAVGGAATAQSIEDFDAPVAPPRHRRAAGDSLGDSAPRWSPRTM